MRDWGKFSAELEQMAAEHPLWDDRLIARMEAGDLSDAQWGLLCGHHLRYSRHFTRFLGALIARLAAPAQRRVVMENLFEEEGEGDPAKAHANLLEDMVVRRFGPALLEPQGAEHSDRLAQRYLELIEGSPAAVGVAALAYGCEAVAPRLYQAYVGGMRRCGFSEEELHFFTLHISCDDGHSDQLAGVLRALLLEDPSAQAACRTGVRFFLDERQRYLAALHREVDALDVLPGLDRLVARPRSEAAVSLDQCRSNLEASLPKLYRNQSGEDLIDFHVGRFDVGASVLDPRLLTVEPGRRTEKHAHAHESLFVVLSGTGAVEIGEETLQVSARDLVYVPRWVPHRTTNLGAEPLSVLAITDYGLTRRLPGNSETSYRQIRAPPHDVERAPISAASAS